MAQASVQHSVAEMPPKQHPGQLRLKGYPHACAARQYPATPGDNSRPTHNLLSSGGALKQGAGRGTNTTEASLVDAGARSSFQSTLAGACMPPPGPSCPHPSHLVARRGEWSRGPNGTETVLPPPGIQRPPRSDHAIRSCQITSHVVHLGPGCLGHLQQQKAQGQAYSGSVRPPSCLLATEAGQPASSQRRVSRFCCLVAAEAGQPTPRGAATRETGAAYTANGMGRPTSGTTLLIPPRFPGGRAGVGLSSATRRSNGSTRGQTLVWRA